MDPMDFWQNSKQLCWVAAFCAIKIGDFRRQPSVHTLEGALVVCDNASLGEQSKKQFFTKSGKSPRLGISAEHRKFHNSKCRLFRNRGGGDFHIFPNSND